MGESKFTPRREFLPFAQPDITEEEIEAVVSVMRSGWLTTGPRVQEFERTFAQRIGGVEAVACNSGTSALHLALEAGGVGPGDEVVLPTYTFTATAEVVRYLGARPVLVDVMPHTLNIDVDAARSAVTPRTRAIIGVDIAGTPCDWPALRQIASERGLLLVDDAAHALPGELAGAPVGTWADLTAFSFYATKTLTTGEGGMLVTARPEWADRARVMRLHGIAQDAWDRYAQRGSWHYDVVAPGFKYNMTDIAAGMGLVQLRRLEEMTTLREAIAHHYMTALGRVPGLQVPATATGCRVSWHLFLLRVDAAAFGCDRAAIIRELKIRNIGTSVHFIPLHRHPYYHDDLGFDAVDFPVAEQEFARVLSLPIYSRMSIDDAAYVTAAIEDIATGAESG